MLLMMGFLEVYVLLLQTWGWRLWATSGGSHITIDNMKLSKIYDTILGFDERAIYYLTRSYIEVSAINIMAFNFNWQALDKGNPEWPGPE